MSPLPEDLVRGALADAAGTVTPESLRPLAAPAPRRRRRLVLPIGVAAVAAAALAVVALVARPSAPPPEPRMSLAAYAGAEYVLVGAMPPGQPVTVRSAATGKRIVSVPSPPGTSGFWDAAGTGDDRTFVLTTVDVPRSRIHFYRLRLNADGVPQQFAEMPQAALDGLPGGGPEVLAATRDQSKIAYVTERGGKLSVANGGYSLTGDDRIRERINVIDVRTGERRAVELPRGNIVDKLVWTPDGRHLLFVSETPEGVRVLDPATGKIRSLRLGPSGTVLIGASADPGSTHMVALVTSGGQGHVKWYSLATGKVDRDVPLGPVRPDASAMVGFGDTIVAEIDEYLYKVTGDTVHRQRKPPGIVDLGPGSTW
ncbi:hypothetical protein [Actinomadura opuntiae]|uniref:hypothetical protein n=1 Tax=Actinomadura sp. OS1-43 TaxID=604315 RepID=UPI00255A74FE|nr:hypothetical protein [Actinomadura sp. OS1-43]MDL4821022.1 hypothetical protein [Actinomadura sp. OS1-43]